ncbi:MAG: alpha-ketoglutarate-dependent dioxygenase AlkB [Methyloligella sp.]|nr:MAG: alpha-ketoglutarate-dependent dioxygenase AlkB [Methyloligella sp.]
MQRDLFEGTDDGILKLKDGAYLLKAFALSSEQEFMRFIHSVSSEAPFRHMLTPGGREMSVAMTNCGLAGWITDKRGYRYDHLDPLSNTAWPSMPLGFSSLAEKAAKKSGFSSFTPNSCLINRYEPGAKMALHQDKDEDDFSQPIVSVSLGLPAKFLFGGLKRSDKPLRTQLAHGDVVVWGGASRLAYHGIDKLKEGHHELTGAYRYNLTFRSAKIIENLK